MFLSFSLTIDKIDENLDVVLAGPSVLFIKLTVSSADWFR